MLYNNFVTSLTTKIKIMRTIKIAKLQKMIQEGRVECLTDLKIGYVEIWKGCVKGKQKINSRETVNVVK